MSYPTLVEFFERSASQHAEKIALKLPKAVAAEEDGQEAPIAGHSYEEVSFGALKKLSDACMAISDSAHLEHLRGATHLRQIITMDRADEAGHR